MASDQEIVNGIESLLRQSNPNAVSSINGIVQQLEAKLGLDLSHKAGFIRDLLTGGGNGGGGGGYRLPPPSPSTQSQLNDHFALHHFPHFQPTTSSQQFPSHFALPHHHHQYHNHHPEELNFRYSQPQQLYQYPPPQQPQSRLNAIPQPEASFVGEPEIIIKKESVPAGTKRRGGPGGLNKVCGVSPELQAVVGEPALPRTQIVKQLWAYIRKHNLQDPSNKRKIICNDALRLVFETDCTDMFKMNKLLAKHIIPLDPTKDAGPDAKRLKIETESATEDTQAVSEITTEATSESDSPTVAISDALANLFATEEKEMTQSEAVRRLWDYIKINQLEDELNPMTITCDSKLQQLFGSENVSALDIAELLMTHFLKS
ncbi:hypothetical protein ACHQM5_025640 [Ranunculus cassubicifolius]